MDSRMATAGFGLDGLLMVIVIIVKPGLEKIE